ncbi:MAG: hypothetical protein M3680_22905 [Myxococcota bacterium]|nr:hypothetical protein [Myxococcota bacterium]
MSEPVRASRAAVIAGLLVALYVVLTFLLRTVPDGLVSLLGGPDGGVERIGGLRVSYRPAPGSEQALEHYLASRANVQRQGGVLLLELPGLAEDMVPDVVDLLVAGGLQMKEVVETDYAQAIGETADVKLDVDQWQSEDRSIHTSAYLAAHDAAAIDHALDAAEARGWRLPAGLELAFERVEPHPGAQDPRPFWRSYALASEVLIDGTMIASAVGAYDPNTNRPIVLLDFTGAGAERFCTITERLAGKKLATLLGGQIRSAPIIMGPICGGRASITMGGADPAMQERERDALIAVLQQGALPPGGVIEQQTWTPAADVSQQEWAGRLLLGALAGGLFGLLVFAALRFARPVTPPIGAPAVAGSGGAGRFPVRRLLVTLLAPLALVIGAYVELPGIDTVELAHILGREPGVETSAFALGITPILTAFFLVELVALAVPRLRWRRHDPLGRVRLGQAVAIVGIACAIVQGYFAAASFEGIGRMGMFGGTFTGVDGLGGFAGGGGGGGLVEPGWSFRLLVIGSLVSGTLILTVLAGMIREHGLGNGYAALIASGFLISVVGPHVGPPAEVLAQLTRGSALGVLTLLLVAMGTACVLRWRIASGSITLRMPSSGDAPLLDLASLLALGVAFFALVTSAGVDEVLGRITELRISTPIRLGGVLLAIPLWAWLFARPAVVARVALQAGLEVPTRAAWLRATAISALLLVTVTALGIATRLTDGPATWFVDAAAMMVVTAAVLDIGADARAHRRKVVVAGIVHQVQYLGVVERVLREAGIPFHLHASYVRSLFAFFGPWAPVIVLVPDELGDAARAKLDDVLRVARATVPTARVLGPERDVA